MDLIFIALDHIVSLGFTICLYHNKMDVVHCTERIKYWDKVIPELFTLCFFILR